jgi:hypothetical protein
MDLKCGWDQTGNTDHILASTQLIAEFQHYFNQFIISSAVNAYKLPPPVDIESWIFCPDQSFIKLLFDSTWNLPTYYYLWEENTDRVTWPLAIRQRMLIYPYSAKYFVLTSNTLCGGVNFFNLQPDDLTLLDALLAYRLKQLNSINEISNVPTTYDNISGTLFCQFGNLTTNISKLIFIYLKLNMKEIYSDYNNNTTIFANPNSPLELALEAYVIDAIFSVVTLYPGLAPQ